MKLKMFSLLLVVAMPAIANALFFGIRLNNPDGTTLVETNPNQTAVAVVIAGIVAALAGYALAATLELLAGAKADDGTVDATGYGYGSHATAAPATGYGAAAPAATGYGYAAASTDSHDHSHSEHHRYKRMALDEETKHAYINDMYLAIPEYNLESCFQRLVCDVASQPASFQSNSSLVKGVRDAVHLRLSPEAVRVSKTLLRAIEFGEVAGDVALCEDVFNRCPWTGSQMDAMAFQQYAN